jgi:S1-C subfamily serine protease
MLNRLEKILRVLLKIVVSFIFVLLIFNQYLLNEQIELIQKDVQYESGLLHNRLNGIEDINLDIISQIQTTQQLLNKNIDDVKNEIEENNLNLELKLNKKLSNLQERRNFEKMINGNVFVKSLFGEGSGTVIKKTSNTMYILTCYHVIAEIYEMKNSELKAKVGYYMYESQLQGVVVYVVDIIKVNKDVDLALLKVNYSDFRLEEIKIAENEPLKGDEVYTVGNPLGSVRNISKGIVSNILGDFYFTDALTTFGNSGGTLYNKDVELIGVPAQVTGYGPDLANFTPESSMGMSIRLPVIKSFLQGIIYE